MRYHTFPCPHERTVLPLSRASPYVRRGKPGHCGITKRLPPHSVFRHGRGFHHASQDDIPPRVCRFARMPRGRPADHLSIYRFPEKNKIPDFVTFSSLLRITTKYEMPTVRSQVLDVVRDAYPETFEGLAPSKQLGESIFSGTIPHPNEVLNLFVQQNITSALPMAYYMAARRGLDSLMDRHLPASARLPPEILQVAIRGLMTLREVELNETHRLVFGLKGSHPCSVSNCPSRSPTSPAALEAYQKVFDHLVGSPQLGTKVLQVPEFYEDHGGDLRCVGPGICSNCVERWESGRADLRMKAWGMLPKVFAPRG